MGTLSATLVVLGKHPPATTADAVVEITVKFLHVWQGAVALEAELPEATTALVDLGLWEATLFGTLVPAVRVELLPRVQALWLDLGRPAPPVARPFSQATA